ncbi:hypothetical protein EV144_105339 [Flavobacterium sp. 270]|uniref:hypothetical protein n=1 Tax=Flavobacterium sp. 270 TaxID=2512114 RepID=UPI00106511E2|nr:hypothetical protein [Flavobacterium sp. 270]TDW47318.1 hypothetical protein EV144_105339 [Flavobacterium sp. 270]
MKIQIIISLIFLGSFINCKNQNIEKSKTEKTIKISAVNNDDYGGSMKFESYSDSTYILTITNKRYNNKTEKFKGSCYLKNDTIYFKPVKFNFNESEKAVIKNNFIEFVDGKFPLKIEIQKNLFQSKSKLDLKKYSDYTFFTFDPKFYGIYFNYKPNSIKQYDLNQNELVEVDRILRKCFSENNSRLRSVNKYVKQCIVIINDKQEKEIWISCYCKDDFSNEYKYSLIDMSDGGNCNVHVTINLTKHNYSNFTTGGLG